MLTKTDFKKLPIFIASMSRWDGDTSSASLALAKVFSRSNPVYYIDFPYSYTDFWRERKNSSVQQRLPALLWGKKYLRPVASQSQGFVNATPKLVLPFYNLSPGPVYQQFSHHNNRVMARTVKHILREKNITDYLFINSFNPSYLSNIGRYLTPLLSVYQSRDAIEETHLPSISREDDCVKHYDMTIATSKQICKNIEGRTNRKAHYLPNGGDVQLFSSALHDDLPKPAELQSIQTPIIGYTGAVCQRIDYYLLIKIARANPDKTIVLVGPRRDEHTAGLDLDSIPNLVFTGPKKIAELPAYLRWFDCTIIPFKCNKLTAGIYPLKINEYLAAGKAVVTTNFSEDIASFEQQIYLAKDHDDFLQQLNVAITDNSEEKKAQRSAAAAGNSWENRVAGFWNLAWEAYQRKQRS